MKEVNTPDCGRANDLISCLYGELNEVDALAFQHHLRECATCKSELASFGRIRESVVNWRNESVGNIGLPVHSTASAHARTDQARPSAIAALREFFSLSPLWLKGAVAFAAVLFFVFGGLTLARLRNQAPVAVAAPQVSPVRSQQEIDALVDQRVQEELRRIKDSQEQSPRSLLASDNRTQNASPRRTVNRHGAVADNINQSSRRPLSKMEREQLAADLRLVSSTTDSDIQLLEDRINQ